MDDRSVQIRPHLAPAQFYTPIHSASKIAASSASPDRDFIAAAR